MEAKAQVNFKPNHFVNQPISPKDETQGELSQKFLLPTTTKLYRSSQLTNV